MDAIRYYVKGAFQGVKESPEVVEQQEELVADMTAKVADLVAEGKSEDEALGIAIASMGDLSALVSEFEQAEPGEVVIPTVTVYREWLELHARGMAVGIGALVMVVSAAAGVATDLLGPESMVALPLLGVVGLGVWWVRDAYLKYREQPDGVEVRPLYDAAPFRKALLWWAALFVAATFANMVTDGFWSWPIWVAGGTWALKAKLEQTLVRRDEFRQWEAEGEKAAA